MLLYRLYPKSPLRTKDHTSSIEGYLGGTLLSLLNELCPIMSLRSPYIFATWRRAPLRFRGIRAYLGFRGLGLREIVMGLGCKSQGHRPPPMIDQHIYICLCAYIYIYVYVYTHTHIHSCRHTCLSDVGVLSLQTQS